MLKESVLEGTAHILLMKYNIFVYVVAENRAIKIYTTVHEQK